MRWLALAGGLALIVLAFAAASRVTDTQSGQVAEVVTLLGGLAGIALSTYSFAARPRAHKNDRASMPKQGAATGKPRSNRDLVLGASGVLLAVLLLTGLIISGGMLWAGLGLALLLPMIAGSVYLCVRFLRANP